MTIWYKMLGFFITWVCLFLKQKVTGHFPLTREGIVLFNCIILLIAQKTGIYPSGGCNNKKKKDLWNE